MLWSRLSVPEYSVVLRVMTVSLRGCSQCLGLMKFSGIFESWGQFLAFFFLFFFGTVWGCRARVVRELQRSIFLLSFFGPRFLIVVAVSYDMTLPLQAHRTSLGEIHFCRLELYASFSG